MAEEVPRAAQVGFGRAADAYERGRPDYPLALLTYLRQVVGFGPRWPVLDVGAGTGKFTRLIERTGASVIAVEPVAAMRERCFREMPEIPVVGATAAALPFRTGSARAITAAQSFHWFATPEAVAEIRRVLVEEGVLLLAWNVRDERLVWVQELSRLLAPHKDAAPGYKDGAWKDVVQQSGYFGPLWHASFENEQRGGPEFVLDRVASVSYVAAMGEADRQALLALVRALAEREAHVAGGEVRLPYRTEVYWTTTRSRLPGRWGHGCETRTPCTPGRQ
jgi:SAM-dependent methyltransferase